MSTVIPAVISSIRSATPSIKTLRIKPEGEFRFKAGQWIDCFAEIEGQRKVAGYSMTSSPLSKDHFDLAIKNVGENPVTRYVHSSAKIGDVLFVDGGHGDVFYDSGLAKAVYLLASGIGIAPHMSIFRFIDEGELDTSATLLYSASNPEELVFKDEIDAIVRRNSRMRCLYTVDDGAYGWMGRTGKLDAELLNEVGVDLDALYYICGLPDMIHEMVDVLRSLGVRRKQMRYELWW
jgi:glycine betaine catabolism B